ncbi:MAG: ATP-dependent helicase [SAR324 cluster bacterium]
MTFDLSSLNPEQREAATWPGGPLLVLAGAGSGKTRVIASRIAWLARAAGVPSSAILAVTFTNKAAREMQERVGRLLPEARAASRPTVCTFHSFAVRLLRAHIDRLGYRREFVIFDAQDQLSIVRTIMEEGDYDPVLLPPKRAVPALSQAKSRGLTPELLQERTGSSLDKLLGRLMGEYQHTLKRMNAVDFEDLLILALRVAREFPEEAHAVFRRYSHVLVDEYQDTNRAQYDLLRFLVSGHGNLSVVGDDDQSIYRWRGAEPGNILDFERDFPGAHVVRLERNYRSTDTILAAANQVIVRNVQRRPKELRGTQGAGRPIEWLLGEDERDELDQVATHLNLMRQREGGTLADFAILYRSNHQSRAVEEALREHGVPYLLVGAVRFYERKEVKDALAYLRLIANPSDEVSLFRVLNFPRRGIGQASRLKLAEHAALQGRSCVEVMREAGAVHEFAGPVATSMQRFTGLLDRYAQRFAAEPLGAVFRDLIVELDFAAAVAKEVQDAQAKERASALVLELALAIDHFGRRNGDATLRDYLEHVALFTLEEDRPDTRQPMVTLMTVHSAKGLEFPYVYIVNLADDLFPHHRALAEGAEEEERRLFYVAVTRARKHLALSMARQRKRFGEVIVQQPSRFVLEIAANLFDGHAPHAGTAASPQQHAERARQARSRFFEELRQRSTPPPDGLPVPRDESSEPQ